MTMCTGTLKDDVVVLDEGTRLPDGTKVDIRIASEARLSEEILNLAGTLPGPADFARNHDHYIHGSGKREA